MITPENKSYLDVSPTTISLIYHYSNELKQAVRDKNLERVKVIKSILMCLNPNAFNIK